MDLLYKHVLSRISFPVGAGLQQTPYVSTFRVHFSENGLSTRHTYKHVYCSSKHSEDSNTRYYCIFKSNSWDDVSF